MPANTSVEIRPGEDAPKVGERALSPAEQRLEDQIAWYDSRSRHNQLWFKALGGGGAMIVVLKGLQLQQYQQNWTTYRSTCERLKHEKFLFLARAGPYAAAPDPEPLLAERVEGLVSQEHAAWVSHREDASERIGGGG
jgi:Protein of unknown function (DUF4231)